MAECIERIKDPADPRRCQFVTHNGQCQCVAVEDGKYCKIHGGVGEEISVQNQSLRNYQITMAKMRQRTGEMVESSGIKSLRDEIALLRYMLETIINSCQDEHELLLKSHQISDMAVRIEKLVASCHKLENSMGDLLDKQAILQFSSQVVNVIAETLHDVADGDKLTNQISERIIKLMGDDDALSDNNNS